MTSDGASPDPTGSASTRAFPAHPRVDRYFPSASAEECRTRVLSCVDRGDGPAIIIGAPGMGKSMLIGVLAEAFESRLGVVKIVGAQLCTRRALLQAILYGLGLPYRNREEGELRLALIQRLQDPEACPRGVALLIDEAQTLPVRLLEELRILSNLARDGEPLVRLVLAGAPALEEQFASTELEAFNQRLSARCYLAPLDYGETIQYVRAHAAAAGVDPDELFEPAALDLVYSASDGVPRLVNQVCDRAIQMAVVQGASRIDEAVVQAAWSDLHQLPAPWHTPEATIAAPESSVVEFGVLPGGDEFTAHEQVGGDLVQPPFDEDNRAIEQLTGSFGPVIESAGASGIAEAEPFGFAAAADPTEAEFEAEFVDGVLDVGDLTVGDSPTPAAAAPDAAAANWNADEALAELPPADEPLSEPAPSIGPAPAAEAFAEPTAAQAESGEPDDQADPPEATPDAQTLFGDGFEEEEIVLDRFAPIATAFTATTPSVVNADGGAFSTLVEQHLIAEDSPAQVTATAEVAEDPAAADDPAADVLPLSSPVAEPPADEPEPEAAASPGPDSQVLVIEPDPVVAETEAPAVERQDYRQLFSSLRNA